MFVDIENAIGCRFVREGETKQVVEAVRLAIGEVAAVVVGATYGINAFNAGLDCPGGLTVLKRGPDGADRALQEQMLNERTWSRFDRLVLVSSDGGFADALSVCAARGMDTLLVAGASSVSRSLRLAARLSLVLDFGLADKEAA